MIKHILRLGIQGSDIIRKEGLRRFYFIAKLRIKRECKDRWPMYSYNSTSWGKCIDIIIPVFNTYEDLKRCMESVLATTSQDDCCIIIINDNSSDKRILAYLKYVQKNVRDIVIINNDKKIGLVKSINKVLKLSNKDIIILKPDVVVTRDWLKVICDYANINEKIATVTPTFINNAIVYPPPDPTGCNEIPNDISIEEFTNLVKSTRGGPYTKLITMPDAVGSCMLIKRRVIQEIGLLDETNEYNYEGENDFFVRASAKGFIHLFCRNIFAYHKDSTFFDRANMISENKNKEEPMRRYPCHEERVDNFSEMNSEPQLKDKIELITDLHPKVHPTIGIDCQLLNRDKWTGSERSIFSLVRSLLELPEKNKYVIYTKSKVFDQNLHHGNCIKKAVNDSFSILLDSEKIDILHRPTQCFTLLDTLLLLKSHSSIITILDLILYNNPSYFDTREKAEEYKDLMKLSTKLADKIIVISNHVKKEVINNLNVPEDKIEVVYLSADDKFKHIEDETLLRDCINKYGLSKGYILLIGTDFPHKNIDHAIIAYKKFKKIIINAPNLIIVGPSTSSMRRNEINRLIDNDSHIKILDYIHDDDIVSIYNCAGFLLYPSIYEGFGLPILEAMACGVPVIASNFTSIPEIAGDAALLIDPTIIDNICEAMIRITTDENLRQTLIERGNKRFKEFSWEKTAKKVLDIYMHVYKNQMRFEDKLNEESIRIINDLLNKTPELERLLITDLLAVYESH